MRGGLAKGKKGRGYALQTGYMVFGLFEKNTVHPPSFRWLICNEVCKFTFWVIRRVAFVQQDNNTLANTYQLNYCEDIFVCVYWIVTRTLPINILGRDFVITIANVIDFP